MKRLRPLASTFAYDDVFHDAGSFALLSQGAPIAASEVERDDRDALEVRIFWGHSVLAAHYLEHRASIFIGDHPESIAVLPPKALGAESFELATKTRDAFDVHVPPGAVAEVTSQGGHRCVGGPATVRTARGDQVAIALENFKLTLSHQAAGRAVPPLSLAERLQQSPALQVAGAALLHVSLLGTFAYRVPGLLADGASENGEDQIATMRTYLDAAAVREAEKINEASQERGADTEAASGGGAAAQGSEGALGSPSAVAKNHRWGKQGDADQRDAMLDRTRAQADLKNSTIIGVLEQNAGDPHAPIAPWGQPGAVGADAVSALGGMWGNDIGDVAGAGGLGVSGAGEGGGKSGLGIGLNPGLTGLGHWGLPGGEGGISGGKNCPGCQLPGHAVKGMTLRPAGNLELSGHIPPEVIQRVIRDNFGRFRGCYSNGLRDNPALAGRVVTRFTVDRRGMVLSAQDGGSSLPNPGVVACIVKSFYSLTFPEHEGGILSVVYPLSLSPE